MVAMLLSVMTAFSRPSDSEEEEQESIAGMMENMSSLAKVTK